MNLLKKRLMWPKKEERIQVIKHGDLFVEGLVTYISESIITVTTPDMDVVNLDCGELETGIEDGTILIQKTR